MKIKDLCFDMDQTLNRFYDVPNWLDYLLNEDTTPYEIAEPAVDMAELSCLLRSFKNLGVSICVITWLSKNSTPEYDKAVRKAKREWLKKYDFPFDSFRGVAYGTPKHKVEEKRLADDEEALIFDDDVRVRRDWNLGGAIDPTKENICEVLKELLEALN